MSHHLDSPIARQDIRLDITDLYVFRGETGTVFVINPVSLHFRSYPYAWLPSRGNVRIQSRSER
jgi:hypothetical protein